jgi:hypothetical protein
MSDTNTAAATPMTNETNQEVGDEGHVSTGGAVSFRDLEQFTPVDKPKKREYVPAKDEKPKAAAPKKEAKDETPEGDDGVDPLEGDDEPKKPQAEGKKEAKAEKPSAGKGKTFKFSHGESQIDLHSDAVVEIPFDGGKAQVSLQELANSYNGQQLVTKKVAEADLAKKRADETFTQLNSRVKDLYERSQKDPEEAFDFLAELSGKDPIEFRVARMRQDRAKALEIAQMSDEEFETHVRESTLAAREKRLERKGEVEKRSQEQQEQAQKTAATREKFGLSDDDWQSAHKAASDYMREAGMEGEPTPEQVVYAQRWTTLRSRVESELAAIAERDDFGDILNDTTEHLLKYPGLSIDKALRDMSEVYGVKPKTSSAQSLSRRVDSNSRISGEGSIRDRQSPKQESEASFFSDL